MLGRYGEVLVMDWGVAADLGAPNDSREVVGTPGFMAPEQHAGAGADVRADVFALGVILDAMLPDGAPRPLRAIAAQAHADDPAVRYSDVQALSRDVALFREGHPVSAYRESLGERLVRVSSRHRIAITLVLAYMIIRVLILLWART
jgi:serine/threonine protein kinase